MFFIREFLYGNFQPIRDTLVCLTNCWKTSLSPSNITPPVAVKIHHLRDIRTRNRTRLLRLLFSNGTLSRHDLSMRSGLTFASISRITKELISEGICYEGDSYRTDNSLGRRRVEICINPHGATVVAICMSAFSSQVAITDLLGNASHRQDIPARVTRDPNATVQYIGEYLNKLITNGEVQRGKLQGATVAIAGSVDQQTGELLSAPILEWHDVPVRQELRAVLGIPVRMHNIADALCLSYIGGPGEQTESKQSLFLVHTAISMGASLAMNGQIVGRRSGEGWIEKICVPAFGTGSHTPMRLGKISSGRAILASIADMDGDAKNTPHPRKSAAARLQSAVEAANASSPKEQSLFANAGRALGRSLVSLTAASLPDRIVLAGPLAGVQVYCDAAVDGFHQVARDTDSERIEFTTNRTTYIQAAQNLALSEYIYSGVPITGSTI